MLVSDTNQLISHEPGRAAWVLQTPQAAACSARPPLQGKSRYMGQLCFKRGERGAHQPGSAQGKAPGQGEKLPTGFVASCITKPQCITNPQCPRSAALLFANDYKAKHEVFAPTAFSLVTHCPSTVLPPLGQDGQKAAAREAGAIPLLSAGPSPHSPHTPVHQLLHTGKNSPPRTLPPARETRGASRPPAPGLRWLHLQQDYARKTEDFSLCNQSIQIGVALKVGDLFVRILFVFFWFYLAFRFS